MYPHVPARAQFRLAPYVVLLLVALFAADDWGLIKLTTAGATNRPGSLHQGPPAATKVADIPPRLLPMYQRAGNGETWKAGRHRYAAWAVLAAVGRVESKHGQVAGARPGGSSSAGALGPMQFMPGTWPGYGHGSVYDPANAIPAAGRYLRAHGARRNLAWALAAYNAGPGRADHPPAVTRQYVRNVRAIARRYQAGPRR